MIAEGDLEKAKEIQNKFVHKIGNLTLTAYNSNLSNYSFQTKRDHIKEGKYIGYRNGLFLNKELANLESWSVENIKARTEVLIQNITDLFKFDVEP